jgi:tetratricopeptide (TPR) repeat protein
MKRLWLSLMLAALLAACANVPVDEPPDGRISPLPGPAIDEARTLSEKGHWQQAITLLEKTIRQYPEDLRLPSELEDLKQAWALEKRLIEDRILVTETVSLAEKITLLERLYRAEPNNVLYQSRLAFWRQHYRSREDSLLACGAFHGNTHPRLAKQCVKQAIKIQPSAETAKLLNDVYKRIENRNRASVDRQEVRETRTTKRELDHLLEEAEKDIQRGAYGDAISKLDKAAREDPDNPRIRQLRSETRAILDERVTTMVRLGDQLYREEKLVHAVAVWEAALELDPDREEISGKIDRARRVMEKLEAIRSREQPGSTGRQTGITN